MQPMRTFPVVRDLVIDRGRMFNALKKVKAWIPIDGTYDLGPGPRMAEIETSMGVRAIQMYDLRRLPGGLPERQ